MLDKMMPISSDTVYLLTAQLTLTRKQREEKEAQMREALHKKRNIDEKMKLNAELVTLKEEEAELTADLEYAINYIKRNGEDYCVTPDEEAMEYIYCIAQAYGKSVYADDSGELYITKNDDDDGYIADIGAPCDDPDKLILLSTLPKAEQELIKRYITQKYGILKWTEHNTLQDGGEQQ